MVSNSHQQWAYYLSFLFFPISLPPLYSRQSPFMPLNQSRDLLAVLSDSHSAIQSRATFLKCTPKLDTLLLQSFNGSLFPTEWNPHPCSLAATYLISTIYCRLFYVPVLSTQGSICLFPSILQPQKSFYTLLDSLISSSFKAYLFA